jgi:hypothetical protein
VPRALAVVLTLLASAAIAVAFAACGDDDGDEVSGVEAGTIEALFQTRVADGIIGSFAITPSGDPTPTPIAIFMAGETFARARGDGRPPAGADHGRPGRLNPSTGLRP